METEPLEISRPFEVLKVEHSKLFAKPEDANAEKQEPDAAELSRPFGVVKNDVSSLLLSQQQQDASSTGNPAPTPSHATTAITSTGATSAATPTPSVPETPSRPFSVVKNDVSQMLSNMHENSSSANNAVKQDSTGKLGKSGTSLSTKFEKKKLKEERKKAEKEREKSQLPLEPSSASDEKERDASLTGGLRFDVYITSITTTTQQKELMIKACLGDGHSWTSPSLKSHSSLNPKPLLHSWEPPISFRNLSVSDPNKFKLRFTVLRREAKLNIAGHAWATFGVCYSSSIEEEMQRTTGDALSPALNYKEPFWVQEGAGNEAFYVKYQVVPHKSEQDTAMHFAYLTTLPLAYEYPSRAKKLPTPPPRKTTCDPVSLSKETYFTQLQQSGARGGTAVRPLTLSATNTAILTSTAPLSPTSSAGGGEPTATNPPSHPLPNATTSDVGLGAANEEATTVATSTATGEQQQPHVPTIPVESNTATPVTTPPTLSPHVTGDHEIVAARDEAKTSPRNLSVGGGTPVVEGPKRERRITKSATSITSSSAPEVVLSPEEKAALEKKAQEEAAERNRMQKEIEKHRELLKHEEEEFLSNISPTAVMQKTRLIQPTIPSSPSDAQHLQQQKQALQNIQQQKLLQQQKQRELLKQKQDFQNNLVQLQEKEWREKKAKEASEKAALGAPSDGSDSLTRSPRFDQAACILLEEIEREKEEHLSEPEETEEEVIQLELPAKSDVDATSEKTPITPVRQQPKPRHHDSFLRVSVQSTNTAVSTTSASTTQPSSPTTPPPHVHPSLFVAPIGRPLSLVEQLDLVLLPLSPRSRDKHEREPVTREEPAQPVPIAIAEPQQQQEKKGIDVSQVERQLDLLLIQQEKEEWNRKHLSAVQSQQHLVMQNNPLLAYEKQFLLQHELHERLKQDEAEKMAREQPKTVERLDGEGHESLQVLDAASVTAPTQQSVLGVNDIDGESKLVVSQGEGKLTPRGEIEDTTKGETATIEPARDEAAKEGEKADEKAEESEKKEKREKGAKDKKDKSDKDHSKKRELPGFRSMISSPLKGEDKEKEKDRLKSPHGERRGSLENVTEATNPTDPVASDSKDNKPRRVVSRSKSLSKIIMPGKSVSSVGADARPLMFEKVDDATPNTGSTTTATTTTASTSTASTTANALSSSPPERDRPMSSREVRDADGSSAKEGKDDWNVLQKVKSGKKLLLSKIIEEKKGDSSQAKVEKLMDTMEKERFSAKERERDSAKEKEKKLRERREQAEREKEGNEFRELKKDGVVLMFRNPHSPSVRIDPNPTIFTMESNAVPTGNEISYMTTADRKQMPRAKLEYDASGESTAEDETEGGIHQSLLLHHESYELIAHQLQLIEPTPGESGEKADDAENNNSSKANPEEKERGPEKRSLPLHVQPRRQPLCTSATSLSASPPNSPTSAQTRERESSLSSGDRELQHSPKRDPTQPEGEAATEGVVGSSVSRPGSPELGRSSKNNPNKRKKKGSNASLAAAQQASANATLPTEPQDDFDAHILNLLEARDSIHLNELQVRKLVAPKLSANYDGDVTPEGGSPQKNNNTIDGLFAEPDGMKDNQ